MMHILNRWLRAAPPVLTAALLLCAVPASAQTPTPRSAAPASSRNIVGVVRDSATGEVLPNARVGLVSSSRVVQANADGRFVLIGVPPGAQMLRVQYVGYASYLRPLMADTLSAPLTILLAKAVVRLSTARVQSAIDQAPTVVAVGRDVSVQSISTAQVEAMPSVGEADVFRTLQMLPSVAGAGNGTASLSVRGGKPDQNLVLLDGITVYHVDHFFGLFSAFNTYRSAEKAPGENVACSALHGARTTGGHGPSRRMPESRCRAAPSHHGGAAGLSGLWLSPRDAQAAVSTPIGK